MEDPRELEVRPRGDRVVARAEQADRALQQRARLVRSRIEAGHPCQLVQRPPEVLRVVCSLEDLPSGLELPSRLRQLAPAREHVAGAYEAFMRQEIRA
ncbi:MAG TPA: hypothetical protein VLA90_02390 [Actinomycetota bacterium]|nr:hypothetical protein [Actinomycetota bacterium]